MGWTEESGDDPVQYLRSVGVSERAAPWVARYLCEHPPVMEQWGAPPKVIALLRNLHAGAWFSYGTLDTVIQSRRGGRQGCQSGPIVFNGVYSVGLAMLQDQLKTAGVGMEVQVPDGEFWAGASSASSEHVLDCAFVDDECIFVMSKSPAGIDYAIGSVLGSLVDCFGSLDLEINWARGKTEAILSYRGKGSTAALAQWRHEGELSIPVPRSDRRLAIFPSYRHLGSVVSVDRTGARNGRDKRDAAMSSYVPIAVKVFGAPRRCVGDWLKLFLSAPL